MDTCINTTKNYIWRTIFQRWNRSETGRLNRFWQKRTAVSQLLFRHYTKRKSKYFLQRDCARLNF